MYFNVILAYPVEPTRSGAASAVHSKYYGKREHQCGEDVVKIKTETKPFKERIFIFVFFLGRKEKYVKWQFTIHLTYTFFIIN